MKRFTHLGRPLDWSDRSNLWAIGLTLAAAVLALFFPGDRTPMAAVVQTALSVFLVWALGRELDPDRPITATIAAVAAGAAVLISGETSVAGIAGLMLGSRILVRSTGFVPYLTDIVAVGVFVGVFARDPVTWAAGLMVAGAVAGDAFLPEPAPARHVWLALAIGVAVTLTAVLSDALPRTWELPDPVTLVYAAGGIVAGTLARALPLTSTGDGRGSSLLLPSRLRTARWLVVGAATLATLVGGGEFAAKTWPVWLTLIVVGAASRTGLR